MAAFTGTATHAIIGTLKNGLKLVQTTITSTDGANSGTATPFTVYPLVHIKAWNFFPRDPGTTPTTYVTALGSDTSYLSGSNVIYITPTGVPTGCVLEILAVGE